MTTITIEKGTLPQTHFRDIDALVKFMVQWNFERELDEGVENAKKKQTSEYITIYIT